MMKTSANVTGEEILQELLKNLDQSLEPLLYTVLAPSVFDVYLHPQDQDRLSGIFPQLIAEARMALDERLEALRREAQPSRLRRMMPGEPPRVREYRSVAGGWYISFHENTDPDVEPGDILVESRLTLPQSQELGAGNRTKRITTLRSQGTSRLVANGMIEDASGLPAGSSATYASLPLTPRSGDGSQAGSRGAMTVPASANSGASWGAPSGARTQPASPPAAQAVSSLASQPTARASQPDLTAPTTPRNGPAGALQTANAQGPGGQPGGQPAAQARLRYRDDTGEHTFQMTRPEIVVGRGGTGYWVDIRLETLPDVSRTHLKIRRDETGRYFIKDVSAYGTTLDGMKLPPSLEKQGDRVIDRNRETLLPVQARIGLADVLFIDFEVLDA